MTAGVGGGETASDPSGLTPDILAGIVTRELRAMRDLIDERDQRYAQRFHAQENAVQLALTRVDKEFHEHIAQVRTETQAALEAAEKAIAKAETATDKRFESVNEFRAQLADQAGKFMPRDESINRHDATAEKIQDLDRRQRADVALINSRLDLAAGAGMGAKNLWAGILAIVVAAAGLVGAIVVLTR